MTGVSWDSVSPTTTFTGVVGTWSTDYPASNLADLRQITKVARVTHGGNSAFTFLLASQVPIQFIGLVRHNMNALYTMRIRLYTDTNPDPSNTGALVHDSGAVSMWPGGGAPVTGYPATRPYVLPDPLTIRSGRVDFAGPSAILEFGGLEIAKWWAWPGLQPGKEFGFKTRSSPIDLLGAGAEPVEGGAPRILNGQQLFPMAVAATTGLDFQEAQRRGKPFVYVQEYLVPASWARTVMLATNAELPPSIGAIYRHDTFQFRFVEHNR